MKITNSPKGLRGLNAVRPTSASGKGSLLPSGSRSKGSSPNPGEGTDRRPMNDDNALKAKDAEIADLKKPARRPFGGQGEVPAGSPSSPGRATPSARRSAWTVPSIQRSRGCRQAEGCRRSREGRLTMAGYGDDSAFSAWLAANGYTLPGGALAAAVLLQRGSTYIDGLYRPRFVGYPTGGFAQERAWPRTDACAYDRPHWHPQCCGTSQFLRGLMRRRLRRESATTFTPGTAKVLTEQKGIKWEVVGDASKAGAMIPVILAVEGLLAPFLVQPAPGSW